MQRAFALYAALIDRRYPVSRDLIEQRIYRTSPTDAKRSVDWFETSFKRDRALLKELGVHIVYVDDEQRSGYLIDRSTSFARTEFLFELDEATCALLYLALTSLCAEPLFPLPRDLRLAQLRLAHLWHSVYGDDAIPAISNRAPDEAPDKQAEFAELLLTAILQTRAVSLTYRNAAGEVRTRRLRPYGLSFFGDRWYVVGHDSVGDDVRVFALSRIEEANLTKETFTAPEDFRIGDHLTLPFALLSDLPTHTVALVLDDASHHMVDVLTRGKGTLEKQDDGTLLWTVAYSDLDALARYVVEHELRFSDPSCVEAKHLSENLDALSSANH